MPRIEAYTSLSGEVDSALQSPAVVIRSAYSDSRGGGLSETASRLRLPIPPRRVVPARTPRASSSAGLFTSSFSHADRHFPRSPGSPWKNSDLTHRRARQRIGAERGEHHAWIRRNARAALDPH